MLFNIWKSDQNELIISINVLLNYKYFVNENFCNGYISFDYKYFMNYDKFCNIHILLGYKIQNKFQL